MEATGAAGAAGAADLPQSNEMPYIALPPLLWLSSLTVRLELSKELDGCCTGVPSMMASASSSPLLGLKDAARPPYCCTGGVYAAATWRCGMYRASCFGAAYGGRAASFKRIVVP